MRFARLIEKVPPFLEFAKEHVTMQRALSAYFRSRREMGSRDRRLFRSVVFANLRMGRCLSTEPEKFRTQCGIYLVGELDWNLVKEDVDSEVLKSIHQDFSLGNRLANLKAEFPMFDESELFPYESLVSDAIDFQEFRRSMLVPPRVHIRIRRDSYQQVIQELESLRIPHEINTLRCSLSFNQGIDLESTLSFIQGSFEVQDLASQSVVAEYDPQPGETWWDVCAASGGKTLGLLDKCEGISLLSSDIRSTIIENLKARLKKTGLKNVDVRLIDAAVEVDIPGAPFDAMIVDVPCSGSGTWARTPEQLSIFDESRLPDHFVPLQKSILKGAIRQLKPEGRLFYSTCSVFQSENEDIVNWMVNTLGLRVVSMNYFSRYFDRADTLFSAVLTR